MTTKIPLPPDDLWRQQDILNHDHWQDVEVTLIGDGGIGSPTAFTLAKMGLQRLTIWDPDKVELHNLPNQMFFPEDIGLPKVEASKNFLARFSHAEVKIVPKNYGRRSPRLKGIVVSAVHSMKARKEIWEALKDNSDVPFYVEGRMGAQALRIHSLQAPFSSDDIEWYESTLYSDEEAFKEPCTAQAIFYTVMVAAGLISNQVKRFIRKEKLAKEIIVDLTTPFILVE